MPVEMLKDCIGKTVTVMMEGELAGFQATVVAIEENWIKLEDKKNIRMINGDMIHSISYVK